MTSAFSSQEVALPVGAEEGFTGFLEGPKIADKEFSIDVPLKIEGLEDDITKEEILKLDGEGRCVITDHGHFGEWKLCKNFFLLHVLLIPFSFVCVCVCSSLYGTFSFIFIFFNIDQIYHEEGKEEGMKRMNGGD